MIIILVEMFCFHLTVLLIVVSLEGGQLLNLPNQAYQRASRWLLRCQTER